MGEFQIQIIYFVEIMLIEVIKVIDDSRASQSDLAVYNWIYEQACHYKIHPPGPEWSGVTVFKTK